MSGLDSEISELPLRDAEQEAPPTGEPLNHSASDEALYEDKLIKVTSEGITIRSYYFPTMSDKFIRWESMQYVKTAKELGVAWYELKVWGMGLSNIWWNCKARVVKNPKRDGWGLNELDEVLRTNIVIKVRGSMIRAGAYVRYPDEAMLVIRKLIQQTHLHAE
ncbi:hypothetical protein GGI02_005709 [Coemansia sp. RSA 2322]|nr:hypothetical protein GGI02_005709 [Coemansia sp. RSA 2322]KAJ2485716.1 hypothetical protein EV174_001542 [Coemansia sp. RSA 2320]